ncbi:hypothetical protein NQ315_012812 [Exocentrus adspersus]|uniref:Tyr recombinase domain-containing protein n=1 Tax=Exocentrus adspersus TaxID=1586481 RepID=A0AAV8V8I4_9CUCU|nr:hypothetical protein NQ315_012812 [Exocentrus adspersus]
MNFERQRDTLRTPQNTSTLRCQWQTEKSTLRRHYRCQKSKEVYSSEYEKFINWMTENCVEHISETVLLGYFSDLSENFSPSSLWFKYSMVKKTLMVNKNINIANYHKLIEYLKQGSKGYQPKKSKTLFRENVLKFIHEAPNETFLMKKVALIFGIFGGCRRQELVNMLITHVEDRESVFVVSVPETKTDKKRIFTIIEEDEMNSLKLIRDYMSLRPHKVDVLYIQPVGKNTFGKIPSIIAKYLGLSDPDKYTGHCMRRTSATLLAEAGASMTTLKRHGGWKSTSVAEGYLEDSISSKNKVSRMLADKILIAVDNNDSLSSRNTYEVSRVSGERVLYCTYYLAYY